MKVFILLILTATVSTFEISNNCPENKTIGHFGDCPESCLSLILPPEFCSLKSNYGCTCREGYVLLQDQEFFSHCIKPEDCPANPDLPATPLDLKVYEVWSRRASVSWSSPNSGHNLITKYIVQHWKVSSGPLKEDVVMSNQTLAVINALHPGTHYGIAIVAENTMGRSGPSNTVYLTTSEEEPSAPPTDVNVYVRWKKALLVIWKPPPRSEWNGELKGFYVGYKNLQDSGGSYSFESTDYVPRRLQEHTITNLRRDKEYSIIVKAFNNVGNGPPSEEIIIRTFARKILVAPQDLEVREVWSNCARVSWSPPYIGNSSITNYVLQYWKTTVPTGKHNFEEVLSNVQLSSLIKNLSPFTNYSVAIVAENTAGRGKPSSTVSFTTTEQMPSAPPIDVNVEAKGTTSLLVTWKAPPKDNWNGELKGFNVGYKSMQYYGRSYNFRTADYVPGEIQKYLLINLRKDTEYVITVQAFNNAGEGAQSRPIYAKTLDGEVPAPPVELKVQEVSSRNATVSWSSSFTGNTSITRYVLQYWRNAVSGGRHLLMEKLMNCYRKTAPIRDLQPGTNYVLVIIAENTIGRSEPSDAVYFTTSEEEPSSPPMDVNADVHGTTSLLVTWKPPPKSEWNGELQGFHVGYKISQFTNGSYNFTQVDYVPGGAHELVITDLRPNTEYSIMVKAFNNAGTAPNSQDIIIRTLEGDLPGTPRQLTVSGKWSRSARVSWWPPHFGMSPSSKYVLQYWKASDDQHPKEERVLSDRQTSAMIKDLRPATNYSLVIVAENTMGRGKPSDTVSFTTSEEEPSSPPRNVKAEATGETSVLVTWKAPPESGWNGELKGFYVGYKSMQDSNSSYYLQTADHMPGRLTDFTITNLHENTEYSVIVEAFNTAGSGPPSQEIGVRTLGGA